MPPSSYGPLAREALLDAASMARFTVIDTIEEYEMSGNYLLTDIPSPSYHFLIDVGYSQITSSLIFIDTQNKVNFIRSESESAIGSFMFDLVIRDIIWKKFIDKHEDKLLLLTSKINWRDSSISIISNEIKDCMNSTNADILFGLFALINEKSIFIKESLSSISSSMSEIYYPLPTIEAFSFAISRDEFISKIEPVLQEFSRSISKHTNFIISSKIYLIENVFLIGGGTRMPSVIDLIRNLVKPLSISGKIVSRNNEEAVILGSAEYAKKLLFLNMPQNTVNSLWQFSMFYTFNLEDDGDRDEIEDTDKLEYLPLISNQTLMSLSKNIPFQNISSEFSIKFYILDR